MAGVLIGGCGGGGGGGGSESAPTNAYATTSSRGDYSEWALTGSDLDATWNVVADDGTIDYTYTLTATCGSEDSSGIRSCTLDSASCADGASACPGSSPPATFDLMEAPGVALFVQTGSGSSSQLHIGFAKDDGACAEDVSGDYTMMHIGLGLTESFGVYRSDANFLNIAHADFGFDTPDMNATQTLAYRTGTPTTAFSNDGCADGVRIRGTGGTTVRSMMTSSGLFVLDLPAGQGGLISFKVGNAATLADFADKTFGGISFPDDGPPETLGAVSGTVSAGQVPVNVTFSGGATGTLDVEALGATATATAPSYPDFSVAPAGYSSSPLAGDYPVPTDIPGLFKIDNPPDEGRTIIAAMTFGGKVVGVGMVYNYRTTGDVNPSTGANFTADGLYNTGNFLLFER